MHKYRVILSICATLALAVILSIALFNRSASTADKQPAYTASGDNGTDHRFLDVDNSSRRQMLSEADGPSSVATSSATVQPSVGAIGVIRGRVIDQFKTALSRATVELHSLSELRGRCEVGPDGTFEFSTTPGRYTLRADEDSLPPGYTVPWRQEQSAPVYTKDPGFAAGFFAAEVEVPPEGGEFYLEIRVFLQSVVAGYVIGARGEPVEGAVVRLQSCLASAPTGLEMTARTDPAGRYEMFNVYPSRYRTEVWLGETVSTQYHGLSPPLPRKVDVIEGGVHEIEPLLVGIGNKVIRGRVVNQDGNPFVGLPVFCYLSLPVEEDELPYNWSSALARARTDSDGRFELPHLPAVAVRLHVGDYEPNKPLGKHLAAFWIQPIDVDLAEQTSDVVEVTEQRLDESRPFRFQGVIQLASGKSAGFSACDVEIALLSAGEPNPNRPSFRTPRIQIDKSLGTFEWACETPHPPVRVTVRCRDAGFSPVEFVLFPEANRTEQQTMQVR